MATNTEKAVRGISSQAIVTVCLGLFEILSFSIMSRLLSQEDFGYYAAISAIVTVFASFSETGIGAAIVQIKDLHQRYIDSAFTLSLIIGLLLTTSLLFSADLLARTIVDEKMVIPLRLMSITLLLNCLTSINNSILQRRLQFFSIGLVNLSSLVITTIVAVILALKGFGYYAILVRAVLSSILTFLLSLLLARPRYSILIDRQSFKSIFGFSGWLMASVFFRNLSSQIDKVLMPKLMSVSQLGAYTRPKDFIGQISTKLNGIFDTALFPVLSTIQDDEGALQRAFKRSLFFLNILATVVFIAFAFNSDLILRVFFGQDWVYLSTVFIILSAGVLFNADGRLADCFLRSLGLTKQQFIFRVIEAILKIIAFVIGVHWGLVGVTVAVVSADIIVRVCKMVYVSFRMRLKVAIVFNVLLSSWRFLIVVLPLCYLSHLLLPRTMIGDIANLFIFSLIIGFVFLFLPSLVGKQYKDEFHERIIIFLKRKQNDKRISN